MAHDLGVVEVVAVVLPGGEAHGAVDLEERGGVRLGHLGLERGLVLAGGGRHDRHGHARLLGVELGELLPLRILLGLEVEVVDLAGGLLVSAAAALLAAAAGECDRTRTCHEAETCLHELTPLHQHDVLPPTSSKRSSPMRDIGNVSFSVGCIRARDKATYNWYFFKEPAGADLVPFALYRQNLERVPSEIGRTGATCAQKRGGAPLRRPASSVLWNHPCLCESILDNWVFNLGPLRVFLSSVRSEIRFGERWRVRSPQMLKDLGRTVGGPKQHVLFCVHWTRLLLTVAGLVATEPLVTLLVPAQARFTRSYQSRP